MQRLVQVADQVDDESERQLLVADDPGAFARAVARVLDDAQLADRLGREGRSLVERRYSWDAAAQRLDLFFREVLAS